MARPAIKESALHYLNGVISKTPLLTPKEEQEIFRDYNVLKDNIYRLLSSKRKYVNSAHQFVNGSSKKCPANKPMLFLRHHFAALDALITLAKELRDDQILQLTEDLKAIRDKIVYSNLRLVVTTATPYDRTQYNERLMDLFQLGCLGLMIAIDKFDHERGLKFSTYAVWWIKQQVRRYTDELHTAFLRLPSHMAQALRKFNAMLEAGYTEEEAAAQNDQALEALRDAKKLRVTSLDAPAGADGDNLSTFIAGEDKGSDLDIYKHEAALLRVVEEVLGAGTREAYVIQRRYGLLCEAETLEQVAQAFGLTRERIRQIEGKSLRRLKHPKHIRKFIALCGDIPRISHLCDPNILV